MRSNNGPPADSPAPCLCDVAIWIDHLSGELVVGTSGNVFFDVPGTADAGGFADNAGSVSWVFGVPTHSTQFFFVGAAITPTGTLDPGAIDGVYVITTATYVPYGVVPPPPEATVFGREVDRPTLSPPRE